MDDIVQDSSIPAAAQAPAPGPPPPASQVPPTPSVDPTVILGQLASALNANAHRAANPRGPKVKEPPTFSGNIRESQAFLYHVMANLALDTAAYNTVQKKIIFFTSFLRDSALQWFLGLLRRNANEYIKAENAIRASSIPAQPPLFFDPNFQFDSTLYEFVIPELLDWRTFLRHFNATYDDPDRRATAERKLKSIVQKTSVAAYASEYQAWCYDLDDTPRRIAENFYNGLKTYVKDEVHQRGKPHTLEEMVALAIVVDNRLMERRMERDVEQRLTSRGIPSTLANSITTTSSALRSSASSYSPRPPPRLAITSTPRPSAPAFPPLTPEERQRRFEDGLCVYCGEPDHIKRDCPKRPPRPVAATRSGPSPSSRGRVSAPGNARPRD
ncbi:hypothetical protein A4X13_0g6654 [Tilletia indica]|uniref:Uncharacterized protein n=1 Tax=Tilletia indica TaxID=43049 RepID=A0A177TI57_9BASI|nr:hypothetical protein A4X13_0g6654 [Tilletia indica]